jgi:endonuclease III
MKNAAQKSLPRFQEYTKSWIANESFEEKKKRARQILALLKKTYPGAGMILNYGNPIQLLVAVMLSAQCTDKKVNEVTTTLFKKYKTAQDFASATPKVFEQEIYQTGFYRAKTKNIIAATNMIAEKFGGKLPKTMEDMLTLPGVARKTANVVLGNAYQVYDGIAVDTHVSRLAQRMGFTQHTDPKKIEQDLMALFPKEDWFKTTYLLIEHGRAICTAPRRKCEICPLNKICPSSLV